MPRRVVLISNEASDHETQPAPSTASSSSSTQIIRTVEAPVSNRRVGRGGGRHNRRRADSDLPAPGYGFEPKGQDRQSVQIANDRFRAEEAELNAAEPTRKRDDRVRRPHRSRSRDRPRQQHSRSPPHRSKHRSRSYSRNRYRSRSRSRSRGRHSSHSRQRHHRSRSRSNSRDRRASPPQRRSHSRSRHRNSRSRSRSRSRSKIVIQKPNIAAILAATEPKLIKPSSVSSSGVPSVVADSADRMLIGNLPRVLTQEQVVDVLKKFGAMKSFVLQREPDGTSKGLAFFEFLVPASIDTCTQALHNADVSGNRLIVGRATPALVAQATVIAKSFVPPKPVVPFLPMHHMLPSTLPSALPMPMMHPNMMLPLQSMLAASAMAAKSMALPAVQLPVPVNNMPAPALTAPVSASETIASNILVLQNMVDARDLADDEEYADFVADVREECAKFGTVARLDVPRSGCGAGLVWIMYTSIDEATAARKVLEGRKFCGRIIKTYFSTIAALESKEFKPA